MNQLTALDYADRLKEAARFLSDHDRFLVVSHVNPDGDAIGSTLAVGHMLHQLGKTYWMVNEGAVPAKYRELPGSDAILNYDQRDPAAAPPDFACVIAVDCADYARAGRVREWIPEGMPLLNIDHHPTNDAFGSENVIRADAAATAEILYDLGVLLGLTWQRELASCVYAGLLTDTGGFRYSNTTPQVMRIASAMLEAGVNGNQLADRLLEAMSYAQVTMLQKALSTLSFTPDRRIAWMSVSLEDIQRTGADGGDLDGLVNYARNIEGVEIGFLVKEADQQVYKVSLRSAGLADVASLAQQFGGGGHVRAAGCTVRGELSEVIQQVKQAAERAIG